MSSLTSKLKNLFPSGKARNDSCVRIITLPQIGKYDEQGKITLEYLKSILKYEPDTGEWTWLIRKGIHVYKGQKAGFIGPEKGYVLIGIDRKLYLGHVLAYFYMTGEWPKDEIDHKDINSLNNKWNNLRAGTRQQNSFNMGLNSNNTTGFKGVSWKKKAKKFVAYIQLDYKKIHLGYFLNKIIAARAYDRAAIKYFGEFARLNFPVEDYLND